MMNVMKLLSRSTSSTTAAIGTFFRVQECFGEWIMFDL